MNYEIIHNTDKQRFEITVEGYLSVLEYETDGTAIEFTHTLVPAEMEGKGIASALTKAALEYAKTERFKKIIPSCSFVKTYIQRHPEYQ